MTEAREDESVMRWRHISIPNENWSRSLKKRMNQLSTANQCMKVLFFDINIQMSKVSIFVIALLIVK